MDSGHIAFGLRPERVSDADDVQFSDVAAVNAEGRLRKSGWAPHVVK